MGRNKKTCLLVFISSACYFALCACSLDPIREFLTFKSKFKKDYEIGTQEFHHRLKIFKENLLNSSKLNSTQGVIPSASYGITKFSDLTSEEFRELYLSDLLPLKVIEENKETPIAKFKKLINTGVIPPKFDWRDKNVVTPVKNQKKCGGCWAFCTTENVESMFANQTGRAPPRLSVQEVIDCSAGNFGCAGGDICLALGWMKNTKTPIVTEELYPLTDESNACFIEPNGTKGVVVSDFTCDKYIGSEDQMVWLLYNVGPLAVSVDATTWSNYQGGIIQWHCDSHNNHAVQIVGYDISGDIPYYIVRNSWGEDFGHSGYLYVRIGGNTCGIAEEVSTVQVVPES